MEGDAWITEDRSHSVPKFVPWIFLPRLMLFKCSPSPHTPPQSTPIYLLSGRGCRGHWKENLPLHPGKYLPANWYLHAKPHKDRIICMFWG